MKLLSGLIMMGWGVYLLINKAVLVEATVGPLPISGSEDDPDVGFQSYKDHKALTRVRITLVGIFFSLVGSLIAIAAFFAR